jgi:hypothetical protein
MNPDALDPRPWPRGRWYLVVTLVFAAQIGLIFAVGDRKPIEPRRPESAPELRLSAGSGELLALNDPTLFALPSAHGFSAAAWLDALPVTPPAFAWNEPERWLPLPIDQLGAVLTEFMRTNRLHIASEVAHPQEPQIIVPPQLPAPPAQTRLRVDGDLAQRHLQNMPLLPVLPYADVLQASIVQVFVDEAGNVVTTVLLPPGSGSDAADQKALQLAKAARFAPLPHDEDGEVHWTRGSLVFQWATMPASTNTPPPVPQ